jgi:hypothetical protein
MPHEKKGGPLQDGPPLQASSRTLELHLHVAGELFPKWVLGDLLECGVSILLEHDVGSAPEHVVGLVEFVKTESDRVKSILRSPQTFSPPTNKHSRTR